MRAPSLQELADQVRRLAREARYDASKEQRRVMALEDYFEEAERQRREPK